MLCGDGLGPVVMVAPVVDVVVDNVVEAFILFFVDVVSIID